jgi:hypothetical protein
MRSLRNFATLAAGLLAVVILIAIASRAGTADAAPPTTPLNVTVTNTPLPVTGRISEAPREPFDERIQLDITDGTDGASSGVVNVPAGKQLVVTHVSASAQLPAGVRASFRVLKVGKPPFQETEAFYELVPVETGTRSGTIATQQMQIYLEAGEGLAVIVTRSATTGFANANASISGYLIDAP